MAAEALRRTPLYEEIRPDVVHLAQETNRIELACFGNRIEAIVNRTVVASVEDDTHAVGSVYLAAGTLAFLVIALIAGILGFGGIAGAASGIAQILFFLFLAFLVISLLVGLFRRA